VGSKDSRIKAIIAINLYAIFCTGVGAAFKAASEHGVTIWDFSLTRSAMLFVFIQPIRCWFDKRPCVDLDKDLCPWMVLRSIFGIFSVIFMTWSLQLIPMSLFFILLNLNPFWVTILSCFLIGEPIVPLEYVGMAICFGCVLIMTLNSTKDESEISELLPESPESETNYSMTLGTIIGLLTSWVFATTYVMNRKIKGIHFTVICFWHAIIGMSIALIINLVLYFTTGSSFMVYSA
jgi:drug/metabolite transporter (DMT)-like permease